MKAFQKRVVDEHSELSGKLEKLDAFALTDTFKTLPVDDRCLLTKQSTAMREYAAILSQRIKRFNAGT
jgi:hypothetical protein